MDSRHESYRLAKALDRVVRNLSAQLSHATPDPSGPQIGHIGGMALLAISENAPCTIGTLTERLGRHHSQMTRLIRHLEGEGLIDRRPDPDDARATLVSLTPGGTRHVRFLRKTMATAVENLVTQLSTDDRKALLNSLELLATAADNLDGSGR